MPIPTECPACGHKGQVPDELVGRRVRCQACAEAFQVAAPALAAVPAWRSLLPDDVDEALLTAGPEEPLPYERDEGGPREREEVLTTGEESPERDEAAKVRLWVVRGGAALFTLGLCLCMMLVMRAFLRTDEQAAASLSEPEQTEVAVAPPTPVPDPGQGPDSAAPDGTKPDPAAPSVPPPRRQPMTPVELGEALKGTDPAERLAAVEALHKLGTGAAPAMVPLAEALKDEVPGVRLAAAETLGKFGARARTTAATALVEALQDPDPRVRLRVAQALWAVDRRGDLVVPVLQGLLQTDDEEIRTTVLNHLGSMGAEDRGAVRALGAALADPAVARRAATMLEKLGPAATDAVPALTTALKSPDRETRSLVVQTLRKMGGAEGVVAALLTGACDADDQVAGTAFTALREAKTTKSDVPALAAGLKAESPRVRIFAAQALGKLGPDARDVVPALAEVVQKEEDRQARLEAVHAIGAIGPRALGGAVVLGQALNDRDDPALRLAAAEALGKLGSSAGLALQALLEAAKDKEPAGLHDLVVAALAQAGQAGLQELIRATEHEKMLNSQVRLAAVKALGEMGAQAARAVPALQLRAKRDPDARVRAAAKEAASRIQAATPK